MNARVARPIDSIRRSTFLVDQKSTGEHLYMARYNGSATISRNLCFTQIIGLPTLIATFLTILLTMQGLTKSIMSF